MVDQRHDQNIIEKIKTEGKGRRAAGKHKEKRGRADQTK